MAFLCTKPSSGSHLRVTSFGSPTCSSPSGHQRSSPSLLCPHPIVLSSCLILLLPHWPPCYPVCSHFRASALPISFFWIAFPQDVDLASLLTSPDLYSGVTFSMRPVQISILKTALCSLFLSTSLPLSLH